MAARNVSVVPYRPSSPPTKPVGARNSSGEPALPPSVPETNPLTFHEAGRAELGMPPALATVQQSAPSVNRLRAGNGPPRGEQPVIPSETLSRSTVSSPGTSISLAQISTERRSARMPRNAAWLTAPPLASTHPASVSRASNGANPPVGCRPVS